MIIKLEEIEETVKIFACTNYILAFLFGGYFGGQITEKNAINMAAKKES